MPERFDLDAAAADARKPIDANWSSRRRATVALASAAVALLAVGGGAWVTLAQRPPSMPTSAHEAIEIMRSGAYDRLDEERKRQYAAEARRMLGNLSEEERRALLGGEENRELRWDMREQIIDDLVRRIARGEEVEFPQLGRPSGAERQQRRERWESMSEEERAEFRREARNRARDRLAESAESGNGQSSALRVEARRTMGGRRGGGGGGPRGGR